MTNTPEAGFADWRKSSRSNSNCVEVGRAVGRVGVRDTKQNRTGPILEFGTSEWSAFVAAVKDGGHHLR